MTALVADHSVQFQASKGALIACTDRGYNTSEGARKLYMVVKRCAIAASVAFLPEDLLMLP